MAKGSVFDNGGYIGRKATFGEDLSPGDPHWSSVVGLLKFEGTNGSTTITDSKDGVNWTSTATISTAAAKFGSSSLRPGGSINGGMCCYKPSAMNLNGKVAFTWEGWLRTDNVTQNPYVGIFGTRIDGSYSPLQVYQDAAALHMLIGGDGTGGWAINEKGPNCLTANTWHHVACIGDGTNIKTYCDGVLQMTYTHYNWTWGAVPIFVGGDPVQQLVGYMDECRFTRGVARYTANFTPPTGPFPAR